jgi:hypothetical protein
MADPENGDYVEDLFAKLRKLEEEELDPRQRELLSAVLQVARDVTDEADVEERCVFEDQFAISFTPSKVELIKSYASAGMITRGLEHLASSSTKPAMIVRSAPGGHGSGHAGHDD